MILKAAKRFFTFEQWEELKKYGLANIKALIKFKNAINEEYYLEKGNLRTKPSSDKKKKMWRKHAAVIFLNTFKDTTIPAGMFECFYTQTRRLSIRMHIRKSTRQSQVIAKKLDLLVHEHQLYAPGVPIESEEYTEFKQKILD